MESIKLNYWIVRDDVFETALWKFYAKVKPGNYSVEVEINDSDMEVRTYKFANFEQGFAFVQDKVHKAFTFEEIEEAYNEIYKDKPKVKSLRNNKKNKS